MKFSATLLFAILSCFTPNLVTGQSYFKNTYPGVWQRATSYTLEVAEAMPAEQYGFKPTEENYTFAEQMVHLVKNLAFLSEKISGRQISFIDGTEAAKLNKEEILQNLKQAFGYVSQLISTVKDQTLRETIVFGGEQMPKENIFYLMRNHMTHHRAQAVLYLRMNGIKPPKYVGW